MLRLQQPLDPRYAGADPDDLVADLLARSLERGF